MRGLSTGEFILLAWKTSKEPLRYVRPHMTMHVRGGWQVQLEDDGAAVPEETDWVAEVENKPPATEVALADILKPGKPAKTRHKGRCFSGSWWLPHLTLIDAAGDFEVVHGARSVIVLDDYTVPEPEVNEPWECLDFDEDEDEAGRTEHRSLSYAEVAAHQS